GEAPVELERQVQRLGDQVIAAREDEVAVAALEGVSERRRVVGPAVAAGAEVANVGHGTPCPGDWCAAGAVVTSGSLVAVTCYKRAACHYGAGGALRVAERTARKPMCE